MHHLTHVSLLFTFCLMLPALPTTAFAQSCLDIFEDSTDPSLSCADAFYFVDGPDAGPDFQTFSDSDTGLLGAEFDGFDLFDPDDPELAPPDNLLEPFFSDIQYNQTNIGGQINSFSARHRGSVSMRARDSEIQEAAYGTISKITFIPFTTDGSTNPVILDLDFAFDFTLADPSDNLTAGDALAVARARIFDNDPREPVLDFGGLAILDLEFDPVPEYFGDFEGHAVAEPSGPGIDDEFDIDIEFDTTFQATPGEPLSLDTETFGSIFTDGFESGDTSAWSVSSGDTFVLSISSGNPNVRFMVDITPDTQAINYGLIGSWYNPDTSGQGLLFDFLPDTQFMFVAAFTFDTISPQDGGNISGAEQRWFTAQGNYSGNRADLTIFQTRNGVFDDPTDVETVAVGTMVIEFLTCTTAIVTYDLPGFDLSGVIPINKLLADEICTLINNGDIVLSDGNNPGTTVADKSQDINPVTTADDTMQDVNYGLIGSWFNPPTSGQGFLFDFLPDTQFMFVAAFTFDTFSPQDGGNISGAEQRWFTAQGNYSGNRADLTIYQSRDGVFDDPTEVETVAVGTMVIEFTSCTTAVLTYDLPGFGLAGTIPLTKLLADEICTLINNGDIVVSR